SPGDERLAHLPISFRGRVTAPMTAPRGRETRTRTKIPMLFCSLPFLVFFAVVFFAYWLTPWREARVWLLLVASFYFYASWNKWLACVIFFSTITDYFVARGMEQARSLGWKRLLLFISVAGNLGLLVYFKYANFFLCSLEEALQ